MSNETKGMENKPIKDSPPPEKKQLWHLAIVQSDFPEQMDVLRYIKAHPEQYPLVIAICHDHDTFQEDDEEDAGKFKNGVYVRKNADGSESEFRFGDAKPVHYHVMIKCTRPVRSSSLSASFCKQVHFQKCSNEVAYAFYLTHNCFIARNRYQYKPDDVCYCDFTNRKGWYEYCNLTLNAGMDFAEVCEQWQDALQAADGSLQDAVGYLVVNGEHETLKQVASKSNFFDKFFNHK